MTKIVQYPYNENGGTHVPQELHELERDNKFILPRGGCFYGDTLAVLESPTMKPLKLGLDYELGNFNQEATREVGASIWGSIFLKNPKKQNLVLDIHYIGGHHSIDIPGLSKLLKEIGASGGKVLWDDIVKPDEGFKPIDHPHHVNDMNGTQGLTEAILHLAEKLTPRDSGSPGGPGPSQPEHRLIEVPDGTFTVNEDLLDNQTIILSGMASSTEIKFPANLNKKGVFHIAAAMESTTYFTYDPSLIIMGEPGNRFRGILIEVRCLGNSMLLVTGGAPFGLAGEPDHPH